MRLQMTANQVSSDSAAKKAATLPTIATTTMLPTQTSTISCGVGASKASNETTFRIQKQNQQQQQQQKQTMQTTSCSKQQPSKHAQLQRNLLIGLILTAFCAQVSRHDAYTSNFLYTYANMSVCL